MKTASCRERLEQALARISDPTGEGARACLTVYAERGRAEADAADARTRNGTSLGPLDGRLVSIKDLFDVAGEPTRAGSKLLIDAPPAEQDAPPVRRLRRAGAVIVAKTNMTEFAFSGVGANPHFGTPGNPADRSRVPGGSSSGAAVAVADGMCEIGIGTDTGGSTRIPAALCGVVGFKPSQWRIPRDGAFPLSFSLDSIGPIARTVADCAIADAVMANDEPETVRPADPAGLRFAAPKSTAWLAWDDQVGRAFETALGRIGKAGVRLSDAPLPILEEMMAANAKGGLAPAEAFAIHRDRMRDHADLIDPNVRFRIARGEKMSAADYVELTRERARLIKAMDDWLAAYDAMILPTTPIVAPKMSEVGTADAFSPKNMALLSNANPMNFFDLCAISLPLRSEALPVGLMLVARNGHDRRLFEIAAAMERVLS
jgi:aspartyl-tRNA(Asn)/glutamyl-tRNA(Gln) amidotransferase subunit A